MLQPIYGDDVFGFCFHHGRNKIHKTDCPNAPQNDSSIRLSYCEKPVGREKQVRNIPLPYA